VTQGETSAFWAVIKGKGKAAWSGPECSRKLRYPDFMTTAQDGGKVVSLTHRPPLPSVNTHGNHFCYRLSRPQGHSATGRIMSLKISNDTIGNRNRDLPVCSVVPEPLRHRAAHILGGDSNSNYEKKFLWTCV
jgi:hypothetical protein